MAKTFYKNGKWIDNLNAVAVIVCACSNKYIKTRQGQTTCLRCIAKITAAKRAPIHTDAPKQEKFDYEIMKAEAAHKNPAVRKKAFFEYFARFKEFPSYLFDNEQKMDDRLSETIQDLIKDPETTEEMHKGITALRERLSN